MKTIAALLLLFASARTLDAQRDSLPHAEIGVRAGISRISTDDGFGTSTHTLLSIPSQMLFVPEGLHVTIFLRPRLAIEPQFAMMRESSDHDSNTLSYVGLQFNGFLGDDANRGPYLFGVASAVMSDGSDADVAFGGGIGYRKVHGESLALRYEFRYRVWDMDGSGSSRNELAFLVGLGALIK